MSKNTVFTILAKGNFEDVLKEMHELYESEEYAAFEEQMNALGDVVGNFLLKMILANDIKIDFLRKQEYRDAISFLNDCIEYDFENECVYQGLIRAFDIINRDMDN